MNTCAVASDANAAAWPDIIVRSTGATLTVIKDLVSGKRCRPSPASEACVPSVFRKQNVAHDALANLQRTFSGLARFPASQNFTCSGGQRFGRRR